MNVFKTYHPIVNFIYFVFIITFSVICTHPLCVAISLICSFAYSVLLNGKYLRYLMPLILIIAVIYPLISHGGITILTYLPDGNPLTRESLIYGLILSVITANTVCWFLCSTKVMTTDKLLCIFAGISPHVSLFLSMLLRFIPRFTAQTKKVIKAKRGISNENIIKKTKDCLSVFSIMITWSAENTINISDSMKSRGFGITKRTHFSIYSFNKRDIYALICILLSVSYILYGTVTKKMYCRYFPSTDFPMYGISFFAVYLLLCTIPIAIELYYNIKLSRSN